VLAYFGFSAWGTSAADLMIADPQNSYLNSRNGDDTLQGGAGNDMLVGGDGDDVISGGDGDDLLAGEIGNDILTGGAGSDGFFYISADPGHIDCITDFQPGIDFISIHHALANTNGPDNASWSYIGSKAFTGKTGEVRFSDSLLTVDLNGDTVADLCVQLAGITSFDPCWLDLPSAATRLGSHCDTAACDPTCTDPASGLAVDCGPVSTCDLLSQPPLC
jgi:hypothetical protein